jgi:hypothetical protein
MICISCTREIEEGYGVAPAGNPLRCYNCRAGVAPSDDDKIKVRFVQPVAFPFNTEPNEYKPGRGKINGRLRDVRGHHHNK